MSKLLDYLPTISWTWQFGFDWDFAILGAGIGIAVYIGYSWYKAHKNNADL